MDADIKGCLQRINKSYRAFVHNGKRMSKAQVKSVLEYGIDKGYTAVSQISDAEIDAVLLSENPEQNFKPQKQ
jgi:hypothetical protein